MSRRTVRRVTAAAVLALALLAGPGTAAAGSLEVAVPAFQGTSLLDRFLDWLDGLWGDQAAASDKSIVTTGTSSGTNSGNPTGSTATIGGNGLGEQGGTIDPDG